MKHLALYHVDAFTDRPFAGNPAAVCLLDESDPRRLDERWMLSVAAEMNLPETAFLYPEPEGGAGPSGYRLRWFTPMVEVNLCGHATLASAHVLWSEEMLPRSAEARFNSLSGTLIARARGERVELDFPSLPAAPITMSAELTRALSNQATTPARTLFVGRAPNGNTLVEMISEEDVRSARPAMEPLRGFPGGLMLTARATSAGFDFVSRFFSPNESPPEDPVTGSAHCTLGPYWAAKLGRNELRARQVSARGGEIEVRVEEKRVRLLGHAVTIACGELRA